MNSWVGCGVSIDCGEASGSYQGTIVEADETSIKLNKAFRNGLPCSESPVIIKAVDIKNIEIIHESPQSIIEKQHSTVEVSRSLAKSAKKSNKFTMIDSLNSQDSKTNVIQPSSSASSGHNHHNQGKNQNNTSAREQYNQKNSYSYSGSFSNQSSSNRSKPIDILTRPNKSNGGGSFLALGNTPNKKDKERRKNEICFGTPSDDPILTEEFDFEKNLALFDKQALWEELNQMQKPDIVRQTDSCRRNQSQMKYRHDENILEPHPVTHRAIVIPEEGRGNVEYVTDDGLVIPTLTSEFRLRLLNACGNAGLGAVDLFGRACTEVALQLLGGTRRLHPRNLHQMPTVAFLIGPNRQGVAGIACAQQLTSHGVSTVVLIAGPDVRGSLRSHLTSYQMTGNKLITNIQELPTVDLIIMALCEDTPQPTGYPHLADWVNQSRAPVLALDPPSVGTPNIVAKYSLLPILPVEHSANNGKLYLCNLAVPRKIFEDLGIQYSSPFGAKFVIALHPDH